MFTQPQHPQQGKKRVHMYKVQKAWIFWKVFILRKSILSDLKMILMLID